MKTIWRTICVCTTIWLLLLHGVVQAAPRPQHDMDNPYSNNIGGGGGGLGNTGMDYNTFVGHFKDFFMYLPVMMTTLKESMTGFPKFAEGIRILVSKNGRLGDDADCKCSNGKASSNEIENSRELFR